jgi:hypothetical protein
MSTWHKCDLKTLPMGMSIYFSKKHFDYLLRKQSKNVVHLVQQTHYAKRPINDWFEVEGCISNIEQKHWFPLYNAMILRLKQEGASFEKELDTFSVVIRARQKHFLLDHFLSSTSRKAWTARGRCLMPEYYMAKEMMYEHKEMQTEEENALCEKVSKLKCNRKLI